jgi:hypothetical protein
VYAQRFRDLNYGIFSGFFLLLIGFGCVRLLWDMYNRCRYTGDECHHAEHLYDLLNERNDID